MKRGQIDVKVEDDEERHRWRFLPPELFTIIFSFLHKHDLQSAMLVNTQWRNIVCSLRTTATFDEQASLNRFQWSLFPNVSFITTGSINNLVDFSLQSVPTQLSRLFLWNTNIRDYGHLDITEMTTEGRGGMETEQYLSTFTNLKSLRINDRNKFMPEQTRMESSSRLTSLSLMIYISELPTLPDSLERFTVYGIDGVLAGISCQQLTHLTKLAALNLSRRPEIDIAGISHLSNIRILQLSYMQLNKIDEELISLTKLTHLDLVNNRITYIPHYITQLHSLIHLTLRYNNISQLADLSPMTRLKTFIIAGNHIKQLQAELLPVSLTNLSLQQNQVQSVDPNFGQRLTNLVTLHIECNNLQGALNNLPTSIVNLYASYMKVDNIDYLTCMLNLEMCNLTGNRVLKVPDLRGCTRLRSLQLFGNLLGGDIGQNLEDVVQTNPLKK